MHLVKDLAFPLQQPGSLLRRKFDPDPGISNSTDMAKREKKKKKKGKKERKKKKKKKGKKERKKKIKS